MKFDFPIEYKSDINIAPRVQTSLQKLDLKSTNHIRKNRLGHKVFTIHDTGEEICFQNFYELIEIILLYPLLKLFGQQETEYSNKFKHLQIYWYSSKISTNFYSYVALTKSKYLTIPRSLINVKNGNSVKANFIVLEIQSLS